MLNKLDLLYGTTHSLLLLKLFPILLKRVFAEATCSAGVRIVHGIGFRAFSWLICLLVRRAIPFSANSRHNGGLGKESLVYGTSSRLRVEKVCNPTKQIVVPAAWFRNKITYRYPPKRLGKVKARFIFNNNEGFIYST